MKRPLIPFFAFFSVFLAVANAQDISLNLNQAIAIALRDNRGLLLKAQDIEKAKAKISEAYAGFWPTVSLGVTESQARGYYSKDFSQFGVQAGLKKYLYQGGEVINTIKYNGYNFEAAKALLDNERSELILSVKKAFYALLLADEFSRLNKGILNNSLAHLASLRARYQSGEISQSDILSIESSLSGVEEAYQASLNQAQSSQALLRNLLYLDQGVEISAEGGFDYSFQEVIYEEAFLKAITLHPQIRQYAAQEEAGKKAIEIVKAESRPSIYASWDYYSRSHSSTNSSRGWNDYNVLGLNFSWPIFDGWKTKAKVEQAIADLKSAQLSKEKITRDVSLELKEAYLGLNNAMSRIKSVRSQIELYKDMLRASQERYERGLVSSLDLDDARLGYEIVLFNQKEAGYDYLVAQAEFQKAAGG
jgi:outer membrane protein TolC